MRALNAEFELFDAPHVPAEKLERGNAARFDIVRLRAVWRSGRKHENRGNEAKEYLKTKDITFLSSANDACLACRFARILGLKGAKAAHLAQSSWGKSVGRNRTKCRLDSLAICMDTDCKV